MTLTTHALVGAAAASLFPQEPALAFAAGFASHFVIDAIPHWDYALLSIEKVEGQPLKTDMRFGKSFMLDITRTGSDAIFGLAASFFLFSALLPHVSTFIIVVGVVAGQLPDFLSLVYFKTRLPFLTPLQSFHNWIQEGKEFRTHPVWGILLQGILVVGVVASVVRLTSFLNG